MVLPEARQHLSHGRLSPDAFKQLARLRDEACISNDIMPAGKTAFGGQLYLIQPYYMTIHDTKTEGVWKITIGDQVYRIMTADDSEGIWYKLVKQRIDSDGGKDYHDADQKDVAEVGDFVEHWAKIAATQVVEPRAKPTAESGGRIASLLKKLRLRR